MYHTDRRVGENRAAKQGEDVRLMTHRGDWWPCGTHTKVRRQNIIPQKLGSATRVGVSGNELAAFERRRQYYSEEASSSRIKVEECRIGHALSSGLACLGKSKQFSTLKERAIDCKNAWIEVQQVRARKRNNQLQAGTTDSTTTSTLVIEKHELLAAIGTTNPLGRWITHDELPVNG